MFDDDDLHDSAKALLDDSDRDALVGTFDSKNNKASMKVTRFNESMRFEVNDGTGTKLGVEIPPECINLLLKMIIDRPIKLTQASTETPTQTTRPQQRCSQLPE